MCCCTGKLPSELLYPKLTCHHTKHTIDFLVYTLGRPEQLKRENELAKAGIINRGI